MYHRLRHALFFAATTFPLAGQALLGVDFNSGDVWRVAASGAVTRLASNPGLAHNALAMDSAGTYWSATRVGTAFGLASIDPIQGTATVIFAPTSEFRGLAVHGTSLLGIRLAATDLVAELVRIDTATGAEILIGRTGLTQLTALTIHNGICYGWDVTLGLVTLSLANGVATDVNPAVGGPTSFGTAPVQFLTSMPDGRLLGGRRFLFNIDTQAGTVMLLGDTSIGDLRGAELLVPNHHPVPPRICAGGAGPLGVSVLNFNTSLTTLSYPHTPNVPGFLVVGLSRTAFAGGTLPFWLGAIAPTNCLLTVSPDIVVPGAATSGTQRTMQISLPLPLSVSRLQVYLQHVALEPVPGGIATTATLPLLLRP